MLSISGWGDTGVQETSTDKLQETVVPIVESSKCIERMNHTETVDEDLIVCVGDVAVGPCKASHQAQCHLICIISHTGRQWWATYSSEHRRGAHSCWNRQQKAWQELQSAGLHHLHKRLCTLALGGVFNQEQRRNDLLQLHLLCSPNPRYF